MTFSRRAMSSIALGSAAHGPGRNDDRAVNVGMNDVVVPGEHAENVHVAIHPHHVNMRVARPDASADDLEAWSQHVDVAEGAVGDAAAHAQARMDSGMDLAPEGAEAWRIVEILKDRDGWKAVGCAILVPVLALRYGSARRLLGADHARAGKTDDRRQLPVDDHHRRGGEANRAPFRCDDLEAIANRRRVPGSKRFEVFGSEWIGGHDGALRLGNGSSLHPDLALLETLGHEPAASVHPRGDEDDQAVDQRIEVRIGVEHHEAVRRRLNENCAKDAADNTAAAAEQNSFRQAPPQR